MRQLWLPFKKGMNADRFACPRCGGGIIEAGHPRVCLTCFFRWIIPGF